MESRNEKILALAGFTTYTTAKARSGKRPTSVLEFEIHNLAVYRSRASHGQKLSTYPQHNALGVADALCQPGGDEVDQESERAQLQQQRHP